MAADWEPYIFNTGAYASLHAHRFPGPAIASTGPELAFHATAIRPGVFVSPARAPYGGFDAPDTLGSRGFEAFVAETEHSLRAAGASRLELALPPLCHAPASASSRLVSLCRRGYVVIRQELNQSIPVTSASFASQAAYATRKRLAKAARAGVTARLLPTDLHRAAYDAIAANRRKKGRPLAMAWPDVQAMHHAFPARVHLFGAEHVGQVVAAALCVAVNRRILYVHAWGEREGAETLSPVSLLAAEIYAFARANDFDQLDLGTSSLSGVVDPGLLAFKRSLGARPSLKLWLGRSFA